MISTDCRGKWAYLCMMRPPAPGAIPREGLDHVDFREGWSLSGHHYWGYAVYTRPLTEEEINRYELVKTTISTLN